MLFEMSDYIGDSRQGNLQTGAMSRSPDNLISQQAQMLFKRLVCFSCSGLTYLSLLHVTLRAVIPAPTPSHQPLAL